MLERHLCSNHKQVPVWVTTLNPCWRSFAGADRMVRLRAAAVVLLASVAVCLASDPFFHEQFGSDWTSRWSHSSQSKYNGRFVADTPEGLDSPALKVPEKAKHYGLATELEKSIDPSEGLVIQYDLKLSEGLTCGGAYIKLITEDSSFDPTELKDDTPYTIMFGPDKCGSTNKVHLILRHKAPNGTIEEKHLRLPPSVQLGEETHVYTAVLRPDNTYAILVDGEEKKKGSLLEDFEPAFNPPAEIDDPEDKKPEDWVDAAKIQDPEAKKPDDWDEDAPRQVEDEEAVKPEGWLDDEPLEVDDPSAEKPEDWDDEEDGEWEAPKIKNPKCEDAPGCGEWKRPLKPNPAYKGKWFAPMVDNPEYKGPWAPRKIANPHFFEDKTPLKSIGKVGGLAIEIWTMDQGYFFDNIVLAKDEEAAEAVREATWEPKKAVEAELKKKKDEEAASKKKEEDAAAESPESPSLGERIEKLFDHKVFDSLRPFLAPALEKIVEQPPLAYVAVGAIAAVPLTLLALLFGGKKARPAAAAPRSAAAAKKTDATGPDDKPAGSKEGHSEIQEEEDEEEEEEDKAGARRRRRAD